MIGDRALDPHSGRGRIFSIAIVAVLGLLMGRLVQLQIVDSSEYTGESRTNSMREIRVLPARGTIMDRAGTVLVDNQPAYSVTVTPRYFDPERLEMLADLLEVAPEILEERIGVAAKYSTYLPSPIMNGVPFDRLSRMLEHLDKLPGVNYEANQKRRYPHPIRASHVLGYVREITGSALEDKRSLGYRPGDLIGQRGVELIYEEPLRGRMGSDFRLRNVHGQDVSPFRGGVEDIDPTPGSDLILTLDANLQALAESLFVGKRGGAVALDPNTGEILAMVSKPDYDLEQFTRQISADQWQFLNTDPAKPFFNRATQSAQMPGSTWKPLIAMIALQEGVVGPRETVYCPGYHPLGKGRIYRCMHVHGNIAVVEAVQESCNTFFFEMMRRLNLNTFARHAREFGFGSRIATDISEQDSGLIPDSSVYKSLYGRWTVGYQMNLGVGQGELKVTPLQLARYVGAIAAEGKVTTPHLIRARTNPETGSLERPSVPEPTRVSVDPEYVALVKEAMRRVMKQGTGQFLQIPGHESGAKTGTAQNPRGKDDSVFIMFAPMDNPQIALAVVVENAGFGGTAAGPIASLMAERYLNGEVTRPWMIERVQTLRSDPLKESAQ